MIKRAWLSIKRKPNKTIIFGLVMFVIANLVLSTIMIKKASDDGVLFAKESIGGKVYLSTDMNKLRSERPTNLDPNTMEEESNRPQIKFERPKIYINDVKTIGLISYVKDYSYGISTSANLVDLETINNNITTKNNSDANMMKDFMKTMGNIQIEGVNSYAYIDAVDNKTMTLSSGTYFDETTDNKIIISYDLASLNNLKVGDNISLENINTNQNIELEIIGIYDLNTDNNDNHSFVNSGNRIYMNVKTAGSFLGTDEYNDGNFSVNNVVYYLKNPKDSDEFIKEANKLIPSLQANNLKLDIDNEAYDTMAGPIENVGSFAKIVLIVVIIAAIIITSLIINNQIKERKYEMGVLLSLGERKLKIIGQQLIEILIISTIAFGLSITTSLFVANKMSQVLLDNQIKISTETTNPYNRPNQMMGSHNHLDNSNNEKLEVIKTINITTSPTQYASLFALGYLIIIIAMIIPSLNIIKYEPKEILTRRDS